MVGAGVAAVREVASVAARELGELLWPRRCVGCDEPETLLCDECRASLPRIEPAWACPVCGAPFGWLTCPDCQHDWPEVGRLVAALAYEGVAPALVRVFKDEHELRLAPLLAELIQGALDGAGVIAGTGTGNAPLDGVAFVPSTPRAYARRGFDPMALVAGRLATRLGVPVADVLYHDDAADQRELGRAERQANALRTFHRAQPLWGARLLLVDDVVTTGSTLRAAARCLAEGGATVAACACVARVW